MKKYFFLGILIGAVITGSFSLWFFKKYDKSRIFSNKEKCFVYTEKRKDEAEKYREITGVNTQVQGFYSPVANTCMTNSQEIVPNHYIQRTLVDELTGKTEISVFEAMGNEAKSLSAELIQEQIKQDRLFGEKLKYFQGE